jgi:hypothetical protein
MMDEMLKVCGRYKSKSTDLFDAVVLCSREQYCLYLDNLEYLPKEVSSIEDFKKNFLDIVQQIASGEINKPQWFVDMERRITKQYLDITDMSDNNSQPFRCRGNILDTYLYVFSKVRKYDKLALLALKFLHSARVNISED